MKFKVGDRVRIKSLDWYNENRGEFGYIDCGKHLFYPLMSKYCGNIFTISDVYSDFYQMYENRLNWTDEMIEGLVEEENKSKPNFKVGDEVRIKGTDIEGTVENIIRGQLIVNYKGSKIPAWPEDVVLMKSVEEEDKPKYEDEVNGEYYSTPKYLVRPSGYQFVDENGNVINAQKIVLEKINTLKIQSDNMEIETHRGHCTTEPETTSAGKKVAWFTFWDNDFADKVELNLSNRELIQEDGKWFVVKKKKEYPKTYEECCKVLGCKADDFFTDFSYKGCDVEISDYEDKIDDLLQNFRKLRYCRDAYWKIAGKEMGLGKPWKPDYTEESYEQGSPIKYVIYYTGTHITKGQKCTPSYILTFPTEEMRDAFYENFKELINECKELL